MENEYVQFVAENVLPYYFNKTDEITDIVEIDIDTPGDEYIVSFKVNASFYAVYFTDYWGGNNIEDGSRVFESYDLEVKRFIPLKNAKDEYVFYPYGEEHWPGRGEYQDYDFLMHCKYVVAELTKDPNIEDELIKDSVREVDVIALSDISTYPGKWMFSDGSDIFYAPIKDAKFIAGADYTKEVFLMHDSFRVKLREKQWQTDKGIKTKYEIEEVIKHQSAKQTKLPTKDK